MSSVAEWKAALRDRLKEEIENFGSTPARAEKSKRLTGELYTFTLSTSTLTELKDAEVQRIEEAFPEHIFVHLTKEAGSHRRIP